MTEPPTILVVDEDPFIRDVLMQKLDALGYRAAEARNGKEALSRVADDPPDLILLDVLMPVMDGFQACRLLKDNEETRLIPVIIMTALHAIEDRIKGIDAGADDFLTKPVDDRELEARIRTSIRMKQTINRKLHRAEQVRDHYAKFVPDVVKRLVAENPDAPELGKLDQDVAFVFVDITGYTSLSQRLAADMLSLLIERYFSAFLDTIHEHGGELSGTAGDGLLVIFHRLDPDRHSAMAAGAALSLLDVTERLAKENSGPPVSVHIGISSGHAAVGSTRFEGVRGTRWVYTAEGFVAILGARLSDLAKAGQILICPETARRLRATHRLQCLGAHKLKGIAEDIEVHLLERPEVASA